MYNFLPAVQHWIAENVLQLKISKMWILIIVPKHFPKRQFSQSFTHFWEHWSLYHNPYLGSHFHEINLNWFFCKIIFNVLLERYTFLVQNIITSLQGVHSAATRLNKNHKNMTKSSLFLSFVAAHLEFWNCLKNFNLEVPSWYGDEVPSFF